MRNRILIGEVSLPVAVCGLAAILLTCSPQPRVAAELDAETLPHLAHLGDSFDALKTLFAWLAFAGIVVSLLLQSREMAKARRDVEELKNQQRKHVFERSFFQLLHLSNETIQGFRYESEFSSAIHTNGQDCFEAMREDFVKVALLSEQWGKSPSERYEKFYVQCAHDQLGLYFRNLYQLMKYVDASQLEDKKLYANIVRAQLSNSELYLIFYNGLSRFGHDKFLPLLRKYEFFERLPVTADVLQADAEHYGKGAFGQSPEWEERFARSSWSQ
jgi:hypothetical protein